MNSILAFFILLVSPLLAHVAIIKTVKSDVKVKRGYTIYPVKIGFLLNEDDILITGKDSSVGIIFTDGTRLSLGAKSHIVIEKYIYEPENNNFEFNLNMKKGKAMFESGKFGITAPEEVEFKVPDGIIGIDGTKFYVDVK